MDTFLLYKSDKINKKYVMVMPKFGHKHYFGAQGFRDFTLMNDKNSKFYEPSKEKREQVKKNYLRRHAKDPKGIHSPSTLSDMILWNKSTIQEAVKDYEKKYNVKVKIMNEKFKK
jgi:hypothetical protein